MTIARTPRAVVFIYYVGRSLQLAGMWLLLVDVVMAGPLGPDPKLFGYGVAVFLGGWALVRARRGGTRS